MDIRILGPLEVDRGGRRISLGPKQQMLLAILLIDRGTPVSVDRIVECLYPEGPPSSAAKSIQVHVSRLRRALGDRSRLQTVAGGYRFVAEPGELDLDRFEALVEKGRRALEDGDSATAVSRYAEALSLWRGPALAEFAYADFAQTEIARLEERRLETLEDRIDADLAVGRHSSIVGELRALAAANPLRERLTGQLMLAMYRSGRQAEALDTFAAARDSLVDTLGIDPGRALRELERRILQQDPSLDLPATEPRVHASNDVDESPVPPTTPRPAAHPSRKTVTAVFTRLLATSLDEARLDPEAARRVAAPALAAVSDAVVRHGGIVQTVTADGACAVFGVPNAHEDDAIRAVRASVEIRARLTELSNHLVAEGASQLEFRIGVSTGVVLTGDGDGGLLAAGEPFRLSSWLGQSAEPGETLLDEATAKLARDAVLAEETLVGAVPVFHLVGLNDVSSPTSRFSSPMVGRDRERRRIVDAYAQAVHDRTCQLFTILGAAGVGKSRLVREFLSELGDEALVARGRCLPYGEGITFWPLLEAVKELATLEDDESIEESSARIAALIADDDASTVARRIAELIGLAEASGTAEESFSAMRRLIEALGRSRPFVLVLDDIHWGEETFLDLVEYLADWCREASVLIVCMARPELLETRPHWGGGKLNATSVLLEPLSEDECGVLVGNLLGGAGLASEVEARVTEAAEGNPLFVEEMVSMLIDDGLLVRQGSGWIATIDLASVPVPPTISALLAARLDRLDDDERALLECAAVEGKVFHRGSLEALHPQVDLSAATPLGGLVRKDLIRPHKPVFAGEDAYRFRHLLVRDAAYDSIPKTLRAELHERHATWLERKVGTRAAEYDEIVGYHLEQAFRYRAELARVDEEGRELGRRAAGRLGRAGRRAFGRSDGPAGAKLISRAVALLAPEDPLRVKLVPSVRGIQGLADVGWADRVLTEAVEASATTGDRRLAAHALVQRALLRLFTGMEVSSQQLLDTSTRAISVFEETNDDLGLTRAWRLAAQAHYLDGRAARCAEASERALVHARRAEDPFEEREIVEWLLVALIVGPAPAPEATARCERLLDETAESGALHSQIYAALAALAAMQRDEVAAHNFMEQSRAIMDDLGEWSGIVSFSSGFIGAATGNLWERDTIAADAHLVPAYEALKAIGEKSHFSSITHVRAAIAYAGGRYEEAERFTRECEDACRANDVYSGIVWRSIRAKVLARRGAFDDAERLACEAVSRAEQSDFLIGRAEAHADLGEVRELAGDIDGAAPVLDEAISLYERKGNTLAAAECRARLASLSS